MGRVGKWASGGAGVLVAAFLTTLPASARADGAVDDAADAYDRGVSAQARGDLGTAAREFARADQLVPSDAALLAGLDTAVRAGDAPLAMELAERASRTNKADVKELASRARQSLGAEVGRVHIVCPTACRALLDDVAVASSTWVLVGTHRVVFTIGGEREVRSIDVTPRSDTEVTPSASRAGPRPAPIAPERERERDSLRGSWRVLSPWWIVPGAVVAAGLGAGAGISWADARNDKDAFSAQGCASAAVQACSGLAHDGSSAVTRANVFLGSAIAVAVLTGGLAALFVDWKPRRPSTHADASPFFTF